jgi:GR25 family glycosyltransferase involved in LPS biosynthesis
LLKKIQSECLDQKYVLILEDDCYLDGQSLSEIDQTIEKLEDWDILRSTWSAPNWLRKIEYSHPLLSTYNITMNKLIYKNMFRLKRANTSVCPVIHSFCGGTHFQAINIQSIEKIINYLDSEPIIPIDSLYNTISLNVYDKKMNISHDIFSKSSIQVKK